MPDIADQQQVMALISQFGELAVQYGLDLLGAILILIAGWIVAGWARRSLLHALDRVPSIDATLKPFFASTLRYLILVLVLIAVLAQFGIQTASIIAMLGAAGLAVGLALQGTLQNIAAGIMLLFLRPFRIGDYIDAEGIAGTIDEIGLFTTRLHTYDGVYVETPKPGGGTRSNTGTSFACPHVTGFVAQLLSVYPNLQPFEVRSILFHLGVA